MSITTINSTMQAQIMQDVQQMQANAQAPVLPAMTFSSTDPDVHLTALCTARLVTLISSSRWRSSSKRLSTRAKVMIWQVR